jgi:uncharacterized protein YraI
MKRFSATILIALSLIVMPAVAQVPMAYTTKDAHLRAGPRRDYPVVAILPAGTDVAVQGCLSDYSWCDVIAGNDRGWVYAGNIDYVYENQPVPMLESGPEIGVVVVPFFLGEYWDLHYRGRPWYRDRDRWISAPRPPRPVGPGRPVPAPRAGAPVPPRYQPVPHPMPPPRPQPPHVGAPGQPRAEPPRAGPPVQPRPQPPRGGAPERPRP